MKLKLPLIAAAFCLSYGTNAQTGKIASKTKIGQTEASTVNTITKRTCATGQPSAEWDAWFNKEVEKFKAAQATGKTQALNYTIPVIVHVIHGGQAVGTFPNLAQGQVNSQITVLNQDFGGTGLNVANCPSVFTSLISNTGVSFCLAQKDPNGVTLAEPGIDRINYISKGWNNPAGAAYNTPATFQAYVNGTIKPGSIWDPTRYMNIWVTDENANTGLLGYATFPAGTTLTGVSTSLGTATTDGLWCYAASFGSNSIFPGGTYAAPYNKGRTATHEIGHWVGLRHIWGDDGTACTGTDYCNDTPNQADENYGCPTFASNISCSNSGDMAMNFMDYTDDACMYMFTNDQNTRIQTAMSQGTYRSLLSTSAATLCTISAATPTAAFSMATTGCIGSGVTVTNQTNGTPAPTYVWTSSPATGVSFSPNNTATAPTINFTTPGTYSISVAATNSLGTNSVGHSISIANCAALCADTLTNVSPTTGTLSVAISGTDAAVSGCSPKAGYIMGSNCYDDKEKAEFFPFSSYSSMTSPQIKSVIVLFYKDGTKGTGGAGTTAVNLKLYNGTMASGPTGTTTPFGQVNATIANILAVTATNQVTYVGVQPIIYTNPIIRPFRYLLSSPVNAPATNGFFASITLPTAAGDTAVIMDDSSIPTGTNWELWSDNTWHNLSVAWTGYDASMAILPEMQCAVTGINKNSVLDANVSLHPNPSNGLVNIIATLPNSQNLEIAVHNSLGQLISNTKHSGVTSNMFTMDLTNYSNGVYFVTISNGEEKIVKRLILNK